LRLGHTRAGVVSRTRFCEHCRKAHGRTPSQMRSATIA